MRPTIILASLCCCFCGCGIEPETLDSLHDVVTQVSTIGSDVGIADAEHAIEPVNVFEPPHPQRIDPFTFPGEVLVTTEAINSTVTDIQVLGFANVGEPRVLLRSKGMTRTLRVGEAMQGVEVVAIHEPSVQLQVGSLVWTANMFDDLTGAQLADRVACTADLLFSFAVLTLRNIRDRIHE